MKDLVSMIKRFYPERNKVLLKGFKHSDMVKFAH